MMTRITVRDVPVIPALAIVHLYGFRPSESEFDPDGAPGSPTWFIEGSYGLATDSHDLEPPGILEAFHKTGGPTDALDLSFQVLIAHGELADLKAHAKEVGYTVHLVEPVRKPRTFGNYCTKEGVTILQHPKGWVVIDA